MPKYNLPKVNLDLTLESGKMKAVSAAATGKNTEYVVPVDQLRTIPGFNVRVRETEDYQAHVTSLKQSIRENGFYPNKPLAGYVGKDGDEDVIYITDGHTRLEAVIAINEEDVDGTQEIAGLPVVLKAADSTMADLTIALVQDNSGRPLTPYEMAVVVQRLMGMEVAGGEDHYSKVDIARKLSVTERYIDDLLVLADAPAKIREHVLDGAISSTLAIQELRRDPKKAVERIDTAVKGAKASGKSKATKKDIGTVRMQKTVVRVVLEEGSTVGEALKALASQIREVVPATSKEDGDKLLVDGLLSVTIETPAPEKPKPEPKAKKPAAKKQSVEKPSKANGGVGGAKKAKAEPEAAQTEKKAAPAKKPAAKKAKVSEVASEDGEIAKLPPKVESVDNEDPDDI